MWLENKRYREIRTALHSGARSALDRVLHEMAVEEKGSLQAPGRCPLCHKELRRGPLPYLEFFGAACPDFHGWWLSPEISKKLRDFIREQISLGVKKARQFKIVAALFVAGACLFFLSGLFSAIRQSHPKNSPVVFLLPMPAQASGIQSAEEWAYLLNTAEILEKGIIHRLGFERALKKRLSPENRWKAFDLYRAAEQALIEKLKSAAVPAKLGDFHRHVLHALENQIVFYAGRVESPENVPGGRMERHPALQAMHQSIAAASGLISKLYPALDPQTRQALQERFFLLEEAFSL